jgi:hypothetical protein
MRQPRPTVFVVDDDLSMREALGSLIRSLANADVRIPMQKMWAASPPELVRMAERLGIFVSDPLARPHRLKGARHAQGPRTAK